MIFKCGILVFLCAFVHLGSTVELTVKCNILTNDYCFIDMPVELKRDDTLKFIVEKADTIKALDIVQGSKLVTIPSGIFKTFPAMEKIFVSDLEISVLEADRFDGAENLRVLNIYNNRIEVIPSRVFMNLRNTVEILLMSNRIKTIEDNAFDGMVRLDALKLSNNHIRSLGRLAFAGAPNLRILVLDGNDIDTIEEGALSLPNLEQLYLTDNKLTRLSDTLLMGAPVIQRVYLDSNEITRIGKAFSDCQKLTILSLSRNPVEDVNLLEFSTSLNLNTLYLEDTKLRLPSEVPSSKPTESKLKKIWLSGNELTSPNILAHLRVFGHLEAIYLMENNFTVINDIEWIGEYFPEITRLGLAKNVPSLCNLITDNETYLKNISVWSTKDDGSICRSADFKNDISSLRE